MTTEHHSTFPLPSAISLWSDTGAHAGFVLLALKETTAAGHFSGECVFMLTPVSLEGIDSDLGMVVSELKVAGEHACNIIIRSTGSEIVVQPTDLPKIIITFDEQGSGSVVTECNGEIKCIGTAEYMQKKA